MHAILPRLEHFDAACREMFERYERDIKGFSYPWVRACGCIIQVPLALSKGDLDIFTWVLSSTSLRMPQASSTPPASKRDSILKSNRTACMLGPPSLKILVLLEKFATGDSKTFLGFLRQHHKTFCILRLRHRQVDQAHSYSGGGRLAGQRPSWIKTWVSVCWNE